MQASEDPTVVGATEKNLIEQYAGVKLSDADQEEIKFIVEKSKSAGNALFKERKYKGTLTLTGLSVFAETKSRGTLLNGEK